VPKQSLFDTNDSTILHLWLLHKAFPFWREKGEYLTEWLQGHAELHCRPRTAEGYQFIISRYIGPVLGRVSLGQLRPQHIGDYCSSAVRQGLSNRTILHHYRLLHKALKDAVKLGLIAVNPCDGVDAPKPVDKEMKWSEPLRLDTMG